jgi:hypothetical protein
MITAAIFIGFTTLVIASALVDLRNQIKKQNDKR